MDEIHGTMEAPNTTPPGLFGPDYEFYVKDGQPVCLHEGQVQFFDQWDEFARVVIQDLIDGDPKMRKGLQQMGVTGSDERIKQAAFCRFGGNDPVPDISQCGDTHPEYWDCGQRPCPGDGLCCKPPSVPNGKLTVHEVRIMSLVASDIPNKQIADQLGTSVKTVEKQCVSIAKKIGCSTQKGIGYFAGINGLQPQAL